MLIFRSILFYLSLTIWTILMGFICLPFLVLPSKILKYPIKIWIKVIFILLEQICKIKHQIIDLENIPDDIVLVASKHQSIWDTIFFTAFFSDAAMVLKRTIILIPFYGLHAIKVKMIWLDRNGRSKALKKLIKQGENCKKQNRPIVIFPEGTRSKVGQKNVYKPGITALYKFLNIPCIPVALNSGIFWNTKGLKRNKGKIIVKFIKPIEPGLSRDEFEKKLENLIEIETNLLIKKT